MVIDEVKYISKGKIHIDNNLQQSFLKGKLCVSNFIKMAKIKTFAINVPKRKDRRKHIASVFSEHNTFG
ncbi:hypothetical protein DKB58_01990 [Capnocytophaga canimorsus]|nr:hypothetical protein CGC47_01695 [Capnocytophaga canimorsus]AWL77815.1 hypothetical protein DKB58_01990 [Capnocytophaga canimorsus]AYW36419.1 hypothetical protein D8L92_03245 [Capnocytophaga canimorsus]